MQDLRTWGMYQVLKDLGHLWGTPHQHAGARSLEWEFHSGLCNNNPDNGALIVTHSLSTTPTYYSVSVSQLCETQTEFSKTQKRVFERQNLKNLIKKSLENNLQIQRKSWKTTSGYEIGKQLRKSDTGPNIRWGRGEFKTQHTHPPPTIHPQYDIWVGGWFRMVF